MRVEDAGGQAQQRVDIGLLEQFAANRFARAAFEKHVVRHHHGGAAVLLEDGEDVLEKVELLVQIKAQTAIRSSATSGPEVTWQIAGETKRLREALDYTSTRRW